MGVLVLILGESGSGKSYSLKNFDAEEVAIFNVTSKLLPFRKKFPMLANNCTYGGIVKKLRENKFKTYVIDDSQYLLAFEMISRAKEQGYANKQSYDGTRAGSREGYDRKGFQKGLV